MTAYLAQLKQTDKINQIQMVDNVLVQQVFIKMVQMKFVSLAITAVSNV